MKQGGWIRFFLCGLILITNVYAEPLPPLVIAADANIPPFVMRGSNNQMYGFDIEMMLSICKIMNRDCVFLPMHFKNIIPSILSHQADLGVGAITITLPRTKEVNFSVPYLLSYAQFLGLKKWAKVPYSNSIFNGKTVGILQGSIFASALQQQGIIPGQVIEFKTFNATVSALNDGTIDFALVDSSGAQYWESLTDDSLVLVGKRFLYGYGFGIAVNPENPDLLEKINSALLDYQNNGEFQKTYNTYISRF